MRKSSLIAVALAAATLTSCSQLYYQVYEVQGENLTQKDNSLVFENEDCRVYYNLWSNGGDVSFVFENKTDRDIFVNMGQTFFIVNGLAYDYYQDRTYGKVSGTQYLVESQSFGADLNAHGYWGAQTYYENANQKASAERSKKAVSSVSSVSMREKEIVCIPAHSYKRLCRCSVNPKTTFTCDATEDYPSQQASIGTYTKDNTPLDFKNRIAYGFDKEAVAEKHIENCFWLSSITNYSQRGATEEVKKESTCYGWSHNYKQRQFKIGGPNKFYNVYSGNSHSSVAYHK